MDYLSQEMGHFLEIKTLRWTRSMFTRYLHCTASLTIKYVFYFKSMTVIVVKNVKSVVVSCGGNIFTVSPLLSKLTPSSIR